MTTNNNKRCKCILPWSTLLFSATGDYRPCCTLAPIPLKNIPQTKNELLQLWNSAEMVELRRRIVANDLEGIACNWCDAKFLYDEKFTANTIPSDNYVKNLMCDSFNNDHIWLNYIPTHLNFQASKACNINCIMCNQKPLKNLDLNMLDINAISSLFSDISFTKIAMIGIWGGEPLFAKDAIQILRNCHIITFTFVSVLGRIS